MAKKYFNEGYLVIKTIKYSDSNKIICNTQKKKYKLLEKDCFVIKTMLY